MESQIVIVNEIKAQLKALELKEKELNKQLKIEQLKLQEICTPIGHHFDRHGGWDGHDNNFYYMCNTCQYCTRQKPITWHKDYST